MVRRTIEVQYFLYDLLNGTNYDKLLQEHPSLQSESISVQNTIIHYIYIT